MNPKLADVIAAGKALDADDREIAALALHYTEPNSTSLVHRATILVWP